MEEDYGTKCNLVRLDGGRERGQFGNFKDEEFEGDYNEPAIIVGLRTACATVEASNVQKKEQSAYKPSRKQDVTCHGLAKKLNSRATKGKGRFKYLPDCNGATAQGGAGGGFKSVRMGADEQN